jgi:hypothetical protein
MNELHLLKDMGLIEEDMDLCREQEEDGAEIDAEIMVDLGVARSLNEGLKPCVHKRKVKDNKWGPVPVERQRRKQNDGMTMLQRAMNLKQKKEP